MSVSSVTEILTAKTADQLTTEQLTEMAAADPPLPVTAYQPGSVALTLIEADCDALADMHVTVAQLGASAFMGEAEGDWLTLRAKSTFDLERILATFARGTVTLACTALAGPETITPGALVITTPSGLLYRSTNASNVVVPSGGTNTIPIRAEAAGTDYNVSLAGATIVTPAAAGMSVSAASLLTWITTTARNEETDDELRTRCRARWATLATAGCGTRDAYVYNILSATLDGTDEGTSAGATRVGFLSVPGDGTVPIRVAGSSGLLTDEQRDAIIAWVEVRRPITDTPEIAHATPVSVNPVGTVTFKAGLNTSPNQSAVQAAISAYVNALPMGDDLGAAFLDQAQLFAAILAAVPGGFTDVDLSAPTDTSMAAGEVARVTSFAGITYA